MLVPLKPYRTINDLYLNIVLFAAPC